MKNLLKNKKGFTLIELMVVVFIIAILAALAIPTYFKKIERARSAEAQTALRALAGAYETYKMQYGNIEDYEVEQAVKDAGIRESVTKKWELEANLNGDKLSDVTATSTDEFKGGEGHVVKYDIQNGEFTGYGIDEFSDNEDNK